MDFISEWLDEKLTQVQEFLTNRGSQSVLKRLLIQIVSVPMVAAIFVLVWLTLLSMVVLNTLCLPYDLYLEWKAKKNV